MLVYVHFSRIFTRRGLRGSGSGNLCYSYFSWAKRHCWEHWCPLSFLDRFESMVMKTLDLDLSRGDGASSWNSLILTAGSTATTSTQRGGNMLGSGAMVVKQAASKKTFTRRTASRTFCSPTGQSVLATCRPLL